MITPHWREVLRKNFTSTKSLIEFLKLDDSKSSEVLELPHFPLNLPLRLAEKIEKNNLDDPILLQFVPLRKESKNFTSLDPTADLSFQKKNRLLQKYSSRVLFLTTSACAMHCRYCFRQHLPYPQGSSFDEEIEFIKNDASIKEVILSGGDPLSLPNEKLKKLIDQLQAISHVKRLRFHTRFPIGIPERIDEGFLKILAETRLQTYFIIHSNHPKEFDDDIFKALKKIQKLGIPVLNQAVLLANVNDKASIQIEHSHLLSDHGIIPLYLHSMDPVKGADYFNVDIGSGRTLINEVRKHTSGYSVPKFVKEIPFEKSKTPL